MPFQFIMKRTFLILLTIIFLSANGAIPAAFCGAASEQDSRFASKHCNVSQAALDLPISCCRTVNHGQRLTASPRLPVCCQVSEFPPIPSRPALPGSLSGESNSLIQLQVSELDVVPLLFQKFLGHAGVLAIAFRPDRSDTYLQSSSFRI